MSDAVERRLAAILSADVVGYSRMMAEDQDALVRTLSLYREQIEVLLRGHRGRLVDFTGDNFLAEFPSAEDALRCAIEIQRVLRVLNAELPPERRVEFRIGANLGDLRVEAGRLYGDGINIAARLEGIAEPGGICLSSQVYEQVRNRIKVDFRDLGQKSVKNIPLPVHTYSVVLDPPRARSPATPRRPRALLGGVATAAVLIAALLGWRLLTPGPLAPAPVAALDPIRSLAVLPLTDYSEAEDNAYFVEGLTEELTATLARIRGLRVISRTSAMQYENASVPLPEIAQALGVDALIEGSVRRDGNRVRITAQLIRASSDEHIWADSYTRPLTDIFALQSEVASAIAKAVNVELTPAEQQRLASAQTVDVDAHEAYLRGRYFLQKGSAEGNRRALEYFELAVREDPGFALGYAGIAEASSCDSCASLSEEAMVRAKAAALRALELDEGLAEAHTALGLIRSWHEWDFAGGEIELLQAMRLSPGAVRAHVLYSRLLEGLGRIDEAIDHAEIALELDPLSVAVAVNLGELYARAGEHARAAQQFEHALELDSHSAAAYRASGRMDCERGEFEAGLKQLERARSLAPADPVVLGELGHCYARAGRDADARELLEAIAEEPPGGELAPMTPALIHVGLGETDDAFAWLERAYDERATLLPSVLTDPRYEQIRTDPRFADLLRRMGARTTAAPSASDLSL